MIAYIDTSVLMRIVLREERPLAEWRRLELGVTSELTRLECARVLDRLHIIDILDVDELDAKQSEVTTILSRLDVMPLRRQILRLAAQPLPTVLGALDSIHLASALRYRATRSRDERPIHFATHDSALARAARAFDFPVLGV